MELYSPRTINEIKQKYGFRLSKSLGQNFLTDRNIIDKIIESSFIGKDDLVIEIGPGIGVLTQAACEKAGKVVAVEVDKELIPILRDTLSEYKNVKVLNEDILKTDINRLIDEERGALDDIRIIGNLPYYITTPIIMKLLDDGVKADSITVMMQKEVAERIVSQPGSKVYGAISAAVQYHCEVSMIAKVPKEVFYPQPKVDSAVLRLDVRSKKAVETKDEKIFFACIKAGFGQRRKTLFNSLTGVGGLSKEDIAAALSNCGTDGIRRAETLSLSEFAAIADSICEIKAKQV